MSVPAPVLVDAPDIEPHREGNTGVEFVSSFDSGRAGPDVLVSAVVHGNELCGAVVLDELLRAGVRPTRGRLTLAFMNVAAYARFDPADPMTSRYVDEDFNRLWDPEVLDGGRDSCELRRAREVRRFVDAADFLLDLHSMTADTVPLMLAGEAPKGRALAAAVGVPEHVVLDAGHTAGRRMRDYGEFGVDRGSRVALLAECGQHWEPASVAVARQVTLRFLRHLDVVPESLVAAQLEETSPPPQRVVEVSGPVTVRTDAFRFTARFQGLDVIERAGTIIAWDGEEPVRTPFDDCVLIMPSRRLAVGQSAVRLGRFV